jgi:hypothetical protein
VREAIIQKKITINIVLKNTSTEHNKNVFLFYQQEKIKEKNILRIWREIKPEMNENSNKHCCV